MTPRHLLDQAAWLGLAGLLTVGLVVYLAALTVVTHRRLRRPRRRTYAWAVACGLPGEPSELARPRAYSAWTFSRAGLEFGVWDIEGDDDAGPIVVATHGWGGSRIEMLGRAAALAPAASRVVLWDMPGHGETGGVCSLGGREVDDLLALVGVVGRPVVLLGHSLGAEVCLRAAHASPELVQGLILEAPYRRGITPARRMLRVAEFPVLVNLPAAMAMIGLVSGRGIRARWQDLAALAPRVPTLVLHGSADETCPIEDAEAIASASGGELVRLEGAGHQNLFECDVVADQVRGFLRGLGQQG
ncbi:MAG: alpha/beta fold hydrolase [Phycisphaeraceae bacterium]|nr:MAG: alpha/beta fold hydrolase [Phycisphaeraceae bacterium]